MPKPKNNNSQCKKVAILANNQGIKLSLKKIIEILL